MSYISILIPAMYYSENTDITSASEFFSEKLGVSKSDYDIFEIQPIISENTEYGVRLHNSKLSLNYLEEILYQKNCMKVYMDKTFESLQSMMSQISVLENELREQSESNRAK